MSIPLHKRSLEIEVKYVGGEWHVIIGIAGLHRRDVEQVLGPHLDGLGHVDRGSSSHRYIDFIADSIQDALNAVGTAYQQVLDAEKAERVAAADEFFIGML